MKSYIQGLITGGVFVFAIMVLMGADKKEEPSTQIGIYQLTTGYNGTWLIDTRTGEIWKHNNDKGYKNVNGWKE
jgi:hypothetical protein